MRNGVTKAMDQARLDYIRRCREGVKKDTGVAILLIMLIMVCRMAVLEQREAERVQATEPVTVCNIAKE